MVEEAKYEAKADQQINWARNISRMGHENQT
jgi:hypothetical protein